MKTLIIPFETDVNIDTTVSNSSGAVTAATVTIDIDLEGVSVISAGDMNHESDGLYRYRLEDTALTELDELYDITIVATYLGNTSTERLKGHCRLAILPHRLRE